MGLRYKPEDLVVVMEKIKCPVCESEIWVFVKDQQDAEALCCSECKVNFLEYERAQQKYEQNEIVNSVDKESEKDVRETTGTTTTTE